MQLRACHYDDNNDILTVIDSDGIIYRYPCYENENAIEMHTAARSRLRGMKEMSHMHWLNFSFKAI